MTVVTYQTVDGRFIKNYNEAKEIGIHKTLYLPIEEDYKERAVEALIKARRRAGIPLWVPM